MEVKMSKKYTIMIIPLIALIAIGLFSANVYSVGLQGHYKDQGGPGASVGECDVCHDFATGYYNSPSQGNLRWVKSTINSRTVKFIAFSGTTDGTLADGVDTKLDGACEVCHTTTNYHTNTGDGINHFDAQNCTLCHPHFADDIVNYFEPRFIGSQSHITHFDDPKGPMFKAQRPNDYCTYYCHLSTDFSKFNDGQPLATTTVCNACHSQGGPFHGVNDPDIGAKPNWTDGVYKSVPSGYPYLLKDGKENWCAGCHDSGNSVVQGISAPNVMGDNSTYGYNISGHGRNPQSYIRCDDCHDLLVSHTDGNARTYSASLNNYQSAYRLLIGMDVPRVNFTFGPNAFRLCMECHIYSEVVGPDSAFRDDNKAEYLHDVHIGETFRGMIVWDSDWSCVPGSPDFCASSADSAMSCTACHNVHGSPMVIGSTYYPNPKMIRHGELISSPGTSNKVPAFDFHWYDSNNQPTTDFNLSRSGGMLSGPPQIITLNEVCWGCHVYGENKYFRSPAGPEIVIINNVWTSDLSDVPTTTFAAGEAIRYNVSFKVSGPNATYFMRANGTAKNTTGTAWSTNLQAQKGPLAPGDYIWMWDKTVPGSASHGSNAKVTVTLKMRVVAGTPVISQVSKTATFRIQ
jgi:cytochrome c553